MARHSETWHECDVKGCEGTTRGESDLAGWLFGAKWFKVSAADGTLELAKGATLCPACNPLYTQGARE